MGHRALDGNSIDYLSLTSVRPDNDDTTKFGYIICVRMSTTYL